MDWVAILLSIVAVLVGAGIIYQWLGAWRERRRFAAPGTLVDIGGYRLHVRCEGAGPPSVVFEAGIAASSVSWSRVQPEVATIARACSYDRAGLAWSDPGRPRRTIAGFVSDLRTALDRADVRPPYVLVGHSFGGMIVRAFARQYRSDVAGLVFVDTLHPEEWCSPSPNQQHMLRGGVFLSRVGALLARLGIVRLCLALLSGGAPGAPRRFSRVFGPTAAALLERIIGEVQKLPRDVLPSVQAHWSTPRAFRGMWQHLAALPTCSAEMIGRTDDFGDMPVVVISAGTRHPHWLAADKALARLSSQGRHVVSPRSAHWVQLDDPAVVIDAVRAIVRRVPRT